MKTLVIIQMLMLVLACAAEELTLDAAPTFGNDGPQSAGQQR